MLDVIIGGWDGFRTTGLEFNGASIGATAEPLWGTGVVELGRDRLCIRWIAVGERSLKEKPVRRRRFDGMEPS